LFYSLSPLQVYQTLIFHVGTVVNPTALVLILTLAVTSILGTVLPQGEAPVFFEQGYSPTAAWLIHFFQLSDRYHSWWFQWLLFLLALNMIACSLKGFSTTWKVFKAPPRPVTEQLFSSLPFNRKLPLPDQTLDPQAWVRTVLGRHYGKMATLSANEGRAYYLGKGRFSRFGVYLVHLSVLVIFLPSHLPPALINRNGADSYQHIAINKSNFSKGFLKADR
jgi:cytochrome c biogenesis protein